MLYSFILILFLFLRSKDLKDSCDEVQSLKVGNETKWGCQAANSQTDCENTNDWWKQCCSWKDGKCAYREEGVTRILHMFVKHK